MPAGSWKVILDTNDAVCLHSQFSLFENIKVRLRPGVLNDAECRKRKKYNFDGIRADKNTLKDVLFKNGKQKASNHHTGMI